LAGTGPGLERGHYIWLSEWPRDRAGIHLGLSRETNDIRACASHGGGDVGGLHGRARHNRTTPAAAARHGQRWPTGVGPLRCRSVEP